ncbi:MAG TPA: M20/M25/M40 family metallo-hydrolase, partial [Nitriliruptorales bacterium]
PNRPPLPEVASARLFARARELAKKLDLPELEGAAVGGGSDGNFTAGVGCETLDGLGAVGAGAHAEGEHIVIDSIPPRTALIRELVADVLSGG